MACCPKEEKYGYEDSRFERDVDENFHCSICYNVLKEPRMCRNNEHIFCATCITQHLKVNSQTCPECNEHLTIDTLRRPQRLVSNYLSKLKINCDHASRGCPQFICLEELETHVAACGYAPVLCSNAECGMEINKQDKVYHESEVCEFRRVKCHDCAQIQEVVGRLENKVVELDGKLGTVQEVNTKIKALTEMNTEMNTKMEASREETNEVKKEVKDIKDNLSKMNKGVVEVKIMITQVLEKLNMLEQLHKLPSPTGEMLNTPREDILIAGGYAGPLRDSRKITEIFSWEKNGWFEVSAMNENHSGASSCIYQDQLFVVGGQDTKTIETLDLKELPLKWRKFRGQLPYICDYHQIVVYQQRVFNIGGYRWAGGGYSNVISELQLTSPFVMKELCRMPESRGCHGAEVFEDKVLIFGGYGTGNTLDSVLEFDPKISKCKEMPKLPVALRRMATVRWREEVIVIGGRNKDNQVLDDVFMYNCKTGKITVLPSMLNKRGSCSAIITGNTIVVTGGQNEKDECLDTVEWFTMGSYVWEYLPAMNNAKSSAVAQVLPYRTKYV